MKHRAGIRSIDGRGAGYAAPPICLKSHFTLTQRRKMPKYSITADKEAASCSGM